VRKNSFHTKNRKLIPVDEPKEEVKPKRMSKPKAKATTEPKPKASPKTSSRGKKAAKVEETETEEETKEEEEKPKPKTSSRGKKRKIEEVEAEEEEEKEAPKKKSKKSKSAKTGDIEKIKELARELEGSHTGNELKEMLRKNSRPSTGVKGELALRVADGQLRGGLPKCPSCSGGYLHLDLSNDKVYCKGYMEDTNFVYCHYKEDSNKISRKPWTH